MACGASEAARISINRIPATLFTGNSRAGSQAALLGRLLRAPGMARWSWPPSRAGPCPATCMLAHAGEPGAGWPAGACVWRLVPNAIRPCSC